MVDRFLAFFPVADESGFDCWYVLKSGFDCGATVAPPSDGLVILTS